MLNIYNSRSWHLLIPSSTRVFRFLSECFQFLSVWGCSPYSFFHHTAFTQRLSSFVNVLTFHGYFIKFLAVFSVFSSFVNTLTDLLCYIQFLAASVVPSHHTILACFVNILTDMLCNIQSLSGVPSHHTILSSFVPNTLTDLLCYIQFLSA